MKQNRLQHSDAVSPSSSSSSSSTSSSLSVSDQQSHRSVQAMTSGAEDPAALSSVIVERRGSFSTVCKWSIINFHTVTAKAKPLYSKYFEVGGYDCRLLVYPKGDNQALPGYISIYLQIIDPRGTTSSKFDCFASYRIAVVNKLDDSKSIHRDSWHRFSNKKKSHSHGWCDFTTSAPILDSKLGFLFDNDSIVITADILILNESVSFSRDSNDAIDGTVSDVLSGKFSWKVHNFSLFKDMIKSQKIMSPVFPAGDCNLRISVYQSTVNGVEYLSMCLESKDTDKTTSTEKSCWCLFRMSVLNQKPGLNHVHRDSYGRFAADNKSGDNTSLGWNDFMKMADFIGAESGFLVDDTVVFTTSFHVIKESTNSSSLKNCGSIVGRTASSLRKSDAYIGKFTWRIDNFTRLKDILKKRKITGLCIKSKRFQIGNRDCRLIVYPRGQSQPPCHLSVFLEVTDSRNSTNDWSCFVSHRLSVVNQKTEEKSVAKESQNRYSKSAKDWGWREFVTLTSLFDQDSGFLVQDSVIFAAEVLILRETSILRDLTKHDPVLDLTIYNIETVKPMEKKCSFTWRVENYFSFKEIMETRKIFSKFFQTCGCELRIGVYESFDTICIYLESDQSASTDPDKNFWVRYRMAVLNQKAPEKTFWKESSICTKTWNNSVLQFMKVSDMIEPDAGFLIRDSVVFLCEILDCCPWFEFSDLEVFASEDEQEALTTDPDEIIDSDDSEGISGDEEDIFRNLLSRAGFHLTYAADNPSQPQLTLREKLLMDAGAIAGFLTSLRLYLNDPEKVKRLLLPTKLSLKGFIKDESSSPSLMNLLMGVKVLQQAIIDLLLDIMVECCQPSESDDGSTPVVDYEDASTPVITKSNSLAESDRMAVVAVPAQVHVRDRLDFVVDDRTNASAVQSSDMRGIRVQEKTVILPPISPPETCAAALPENASLNPKLKWPEQSDELLGLIVNSLKGLDGDVPQNCGESRDPRRKPQSAQKIDLVLDKAPKHLQNDLISLVPRIVENYEHPLAASALLDRLRKPDAEPSLRLPVFGALGQLECESDVWERVLCESCDFLSDSNDEPLAATVDFIFKAALNCQHLSEAVRSVRARLKDLGSDVSSCVLDHLIRILKTCGDVGKSFLRDIDSDDGFRNTCLSMLGGVFLFGEKNGHLSEKLSSTFAHFSDIYVLIEMLSIPCLAIEASQTFERAVSRGGITAQSVAFILEKRLSQRLNLNKQGEEKESSNVERETIDHFTLVLGLAETLSVSRDPHVRGFVKMLYTLLFKWYSDQSNRFRILKRLVDRVISSNHADTNSEVDMDLEILVVLICEEQEIVRPVLSMMREVAELANVDRAALWHQLCAREDEILQISEEKKTQERKMNIEKDDLLQRLSESEATTSSLKTEMKAELDRIGREKREVFEERQDLEYQLEWLRSERDEEVSKLNSDKKVLQQRLHDSETQLSQLKSRKRDELKKVTKEKNVLAERLRSSEAARSRLDDEMKRYATEKVNRDEMRQSLEAQVRRLTQAVGQSQTEKCEKEEQVTRCEAYIHAMESKLQACQQYIETLDASLKEEMSRHAPLYGVGLECLSMKELDTISRIHEEGLSQIRALQQLNSSPAGSSPTMSPHSSNAGAASLYDPLLSSAVLSNGDVNASLGPWYHHS